MTTLFILKTSYFGQSSRLISHPPTIPSRMSLPPDVISAIESHLGHPVTGSPFSILETHIAQLPPGLARAVGTSIPPRDRTRIPIIRRRRHVHAHADPPPHSLSAEAGRLRWPLLWERLGGDPRVLAETREQAEERQWGDTQFMPHEERFVGRLGRMLAEEAEIREWQTAREARARERRLDDVGEEFDDSDDDDDAAVPVNGSSGNAVNGTNGTNGTNGGTVNGVSGSNASVPVSADPGDQDQYAVAENFERRLLELFIDGMDVSESAKYL